MKRQGSGIREAGWLPVVFSAGLIAGATMLSPVAVEARVPYRSAGQSETKAPAVAKTSDRPAATTKPATDAGSCESGTCARPQSGLSLAAADDHKYGTTVTWVDSPREAGKLAAEQHKLAFVIQLSGDFTRDEFT